MHFKKMGQEGYEPDFSLYHLVALACTHLHNVYTCQDVLKVHAGRNSYFTCCVGSYVQNRLHAAQDEPNLMKSQSSKYLLRFGVLGMFLRPKYPQSPGVFEA